MQIEKKRSDAAQEANSAEDSASFDARLAKYAATQAGGDGIEGDVAKKHKSDGEKLGAQMPDRK
jgi:hypothetical protein